MKLKFTLQDGLDNLEMLGVKPSEINVGKEGIKQLTEMAKDIAFKKILAKKRPSSNLPTK